MWTVSLLVQDFEYKQLVFVKIAAMNIRKSIFLEKKGTKRHCFFKFLTFFCITSRWVVTFWNTFWKIWYGIMLRACVPQGAYEHAIWRGKISQQFSSSKFKWSSPNVQLMIAMWQKIEFQSHRSKSKKRSKTGNS